MIKGNHPTICITRQTLADKKQIIMTTYLAVEKLKYIQPKPIVLLHSKVIELHPEETAAVVTYNEKIHQYIRPGQRLKEYKQEMKEYKCLDCGATWHENIHAPLIVDEITLHEYYKNHTLCKSVYAK